MNNYYYKKDTRRIKKNFRITSLAVTAVGLFVLVYIFFPLVSWQLYFAPVFASQSIAAPIPKTTVVNPATFQALLSEATAAMSGVDYTNALNWFPNQSPSNGGEHGAKIPFYYLSIPKLDIKNAVVSTQDYDLGKHLVNYLGTSVPPDNGTAIVFGHSTLPQWFNPKDYKTIFAKAYTLQIGDEIFIENSEVSYRYKIFNTLIVSPQDSSVFSQNFDNSYITLVTCTPPGTTWKRLLIKARLEKI